jgi:thioredoxin-like negative regulator of GroEL
MAVNSSQISTSRFKTSGIIAGLLIVVFAISTVFLTRTDDSVVNLSPVSGLMSLKSTAQTAMPYAQAMANPQPTLIEFYADWCTTCQALAPTLASLHDEYGDRINFVMLNIDDPRWSQQVKQFQVAGVPHLALVGSNTGLVDTLIGKVPKSVLSQRLNKLLS